MLFSYCYLRGIGLSNTDMKPVEERLDRIIALLKVLARKEIEERRRLILSTPKKRQIYELCDGTNEAGRIATKVKVTGQYVRMTIRDLEDAGFVVVKQDGTRRYPVKVI